MVKKLMGGKDPFFRPIRITKEKQSKKFILSGKGMFKVFNTKKEALAFKKKINL